MTFWVPTTFVWVASNGLYSPGFDVLERRAVEDEVDALHRPVEPVTIADVADQEAQVLPPGVPLALVELLGLVAPEDPHDAASRARASARRGGRRSSPNRRSRARDDPPACRGRRWSGLLVVVSAAPRPGVTMRDAVRRVPRPRVAGPGRTRRTRRDFSGVAAGGAPGSAGSSTRQDRRCGRRAERWAEPPVERERGAGSPPPGDAPAHPSVGPEGRAEHRPVARPCRRDELPPAPARGLEDELDQGLAGRDDLGRDRGEERADRRRTGARWPGRAGRAPSGPGRSGRSGRAARSRPRLIARRVAASAMSASTSSETARKTSGAMRAMSAARPADALVADVMVSTQWSGWGWVHS